MSDSTSDKPATTGAPAATAGRAAAGGPTVANGPAGEHPAGPTGGRLPDLTAEEKAKPYSKTTMGPSQHRIRRSWPSSDRISRWTLPRSCCPRA